MKRRFALILVLAMLLSLVACSNNETEPTTPSNPTTPTVSTEAPTDATEKPTEPTQAPTEEPTVAPTQKPTAAPTQKPTIAPTQKPTTPPTQKPTAAPTKAPTVPETAAPTVSLTNAPTVVTTQSPTICDHDWVAATCTAPKVCKKCGEIEGDIGSHIYNKTVIAPTCTTQGYTEYKCLCGDTYQEDFVNPKHRYKKYICEVCSEIDKTHALDYLVEQVMSKGTPNGTYTSVVMEELDGVKFELKYDAQEKCLWVTCREEMLNAVLTTILSVEDGLYGINYVYEESYESDLVGVIDPETFKENSAMTYEVYTGLDDLKISMLNLARTSVTMLIATLENYLITQDLGITVYDLGYMSFYN